jgi:hypothetical protein
VLALYQRTKSLDVELWTSLREPDLPAPLSFEPDRAVPTAGEELPHLTPAGHAPRPNEFSKDRTNGEIEPVGHPDRQLKAMHEV